MEKELKKNNMPIKRKKPPAPSKKKSLGYYAKVNKKGGTGKKAGGGMTAKGVAKYRSCLLYTSPSPRDS